MITTKLIEGEINGTRTYKTMVPIDQLKEDPNNPRDISADKLKDLVDFLSRYQELKPLLVDVRPEKEGQLIGGNMRLRAYKILGWTEAWVELRNPVSDAEAFEQATIDNMEFGQYVEDKLKTLLDKYKEDIDFSKLAVTLETPPSFEELLKQFSNNKDIKEDEPPAVNDKEPAVSQLGEVYQLGRHRVGCMDSTIKENVERLMAFTESVNK